MRICDSTQDAKLRHLRTKDDVRSLEREMAALREQTAHLLTKADMYLLIGIASTVAVAAVFNAIKLIFFSGS